MSLFVVLMPEISHLVGTLLEITKLMGKALIEKHQYVRHFSSKIIQLYLQTIRKYNFLVILSFLSNSERKMENIVQNMQLNFFLLK